MREYFRSDRFQCSANLDPIIQRCGQQLYDDFTELRPGAANDLAKRLDHSRKSRADSEIYPESAKSSSEPQVESEGYPVGTTVHKASIITPESIAAFKAASQATLTRALKGTFATAAVASAVKTASPYLTSSADRRTGDISIPAATPLPPARLRQGASNNQQPSPFQQEVKLHEDKEQPNSTEAATQEPLFLLTCISVGRYATSLIQLDLQHPQPTVSDRQLLHLLRTRYTHLRRTWHRALLSFHTLTSIDFVQFELHRKSLVDIRKRNDIPPEDRRNEYRYRPVPAEVIPPVGKNFLMHIYHHPEDADQETVCLARFPKRVKETLKLGGADMPVGWGIEFVEGVHWNKVWCFGFAIVAVSLVTGVVWSCVRRDVQGGFGIAGYMMAFLTFMVGMLQAAS